MRKKQIDIVVELRSMSECDPSCWGRCRRCPDDITREAADEIERLRKHIKDLTKTD